MDEYIIVEEKKERKEKRKDRPHCPRSSRPRYRAGNPVIRRKESPRPPELLGTELALETIRKH